MQLSHHFSLEEFQHSQTAERAGIDNIVPQALIPSLAMLCTMVLEPIRAKMGPLHINSGYRCEELNRKIGGAANSQHVLGQAADITSASVSPLELCRWIQESGIKFDELIQEGSWVHISYNPNGMQRGKVLTAHFSASGTNYTEGL